LRATGAVLLVEDNEEVAEIAAVLLGQLGYRVTRSRSAREGLETLAGGGEYDLLISDIVMPGGINGLDLARAVRRHFPGLRVLLTTGYSSAAQEAVAEGFTILMKPYRLETLASAIAGETGPAARTATGP
jgi:CheY-like chemotaxis protein